MDNLFVTYDIAKALKEKGFDEPCFAYYCKHRNTVIIPEQETLDKLTPFLDIFAVNSQKHFVYQECSAPIRQQVIDWFEKKHGLFLCVEHGGKVNGTYKHDVMIWGRISTTMRGFTSTEKAWEKAILKAITLI